MKKMFLGALLISFSVITGVNAQNFKKGDKIVEGTVSYSKSKGSDAEYAISPSVGYFVSDKSAVGITADLGSSADGDVTNVGVYARKYFHSIGKNFLTYAQLNAGSNTTKASGVKTSEFAAGFGLGANYFVSPKVAVSMHVADLLSYTSGDGASNFSLGFNGFNNPFSMAKFGVLIKL